MWKSMKRSLPLVLLLITASGAEARVTCEVTQITDATGAGSGSAVLDADGSHIAFVSHADLTGENPDGNSELFLYTDSTITQITDSLPAGNLIAVLRAAIDSDGSHIAFSADADLTGQNPDGGREIFLFDGTTISQITSSSSGVVGHPSIDSDGSHIAFSHDGDLTGENPDGNREVFLYDGTSITQVTRSTTGGAGISPVIDSDGSHIALTYSGDLGGQNPEGNSEVFLYDGSSFQQITSSAVGSSGAADIDSDGSHVAIVSDADLTGGNPDGNREVFLYDGSSISQITHSTTGSHGFPAINQFLVMDADGRRLAFTSDADLIGESPEGDTEVFLYDGSTLSQITKAAVRFSFSSSINADGSRIAFFSDADLTGRNPDHSQEVFVASCVSEPSIVEIPTLGGLGAATLTALLLVAALVLLGLRCAA